MDAQTHEALADAIRRSTTPSRLLLGRYLVEDELGRGGSGVVYVAHDTLLDRRVAVKEVPLMGQSSRRLLAEFTALSRISHPHVLTLHHAETVGRAVVLVLEHAPGGSLADWLREGPLPPAKATAITLDVLDALSAVHAHGLVHRDVKPENVLFDALGRVKLSDFGAAQLDLEPEATRTLDLVGTPCCMAPEQILGETITPRTDIYGVAAMLYRMLTHEHYVRMDGPVHERWERVLTNPPRLPHARVPASLVDVLARGLAKAPAERFASADEMAKAVREASRRLEHEV